MQILINTKQDVDSFPAPTNYARLSLLKTHLMLESNSTSTVKI